MTQVDMEGMGASDVRLFEDRVLTDRLKSRIHLLLQMDSDKRKGVHVSDLLFLRKGYFSKKFHEPLTDTELGYFVAGRGHHAIIQALREDREFDEVELSWNGITGNVDILGDTVIEVKTTRVRKKYDINTVPEHWLEQLGMYVAMVHPNSVQGSGILFVLYLMDATFKCYRITFENLPSIRKKMLSRAMMLTTSIDAGKFTILPLCPVWLCSKEKCKWYSRCAPPPVIRCPDCDRMKRDGTLCACQVKSEAARQAGLPASWAPKYAPPEH